MDKKVFSIIIPVFNVQEYLERCVDSILYQTIDKELIEVILVDDGSKDNSSLICDQYAEQYDFIKVIHQENGGLSVARNSGILQAVGDYILLLDSDDYLTESACDQFMEIISKSKKSPDIIVGLVQKYEDGCKSIIKKTTTGLSVITGETYLFKELKGESLRIMAQSSIYKRSFLEDNHLLFAKGYLHEDEEFTPRAFLFAKTVISTDIVFYNYIIRENSITTSKSKRRNAECILKIVKDLDSFYCQVHNVDLRDLLMGHSAKITYNGIKAGKMYSRKDLSSSDIELLKKNSITAKDKFRYYVYRICPRLLQYIG